MNLDFKKNAGLIPAIIQDAVTNKVLMLGYMNLEAYQKTLAEKRVTFFSRSKNALWTKGETSGNYLNVINVYEDCDKDTLLIKVNPAGPVCHTGADTCFNEENSANYFLYALEKIIQNRIDENKDDSYTVKLIKSGKNKIAQKVGEEAVETIIEALNGNNERFKEETADLLYHLLVLLADQKTTLKNISDILEKRHK